MRSRFSWLLPAAVLAALALPAPAAGEPGHRVHLTPALVDLARSYPRLLPAQKRAAQKLLARPTGPRDPTATPPPHRWPPTAPRTSVSTG